MSEVVEPAQQVGVLIRGVEAPINRGKLYLTSWWLLAILSVLLWYRNVGIDRGLALLTFTWALLPLIWYGVCNQVDPKQAASLIVVVLCLQMVLWPASLYIMSGDSPLLLMIGLALAVMICAALLVMLGSTGSCISDRGSINWEESPDSGWLLAYGLVVILPLLFVSIDPDKASLLAAFVALFLAYLIYMIDIQPTILITIGITGFAFMAWILGIC